MRIIFMGTPQFAVPCLEALVTAGHEIPAVLCQPDKPQGRKMQLRPPPVKICALSHELTVLQPEKLRNNEALLAQLRAMRPDLAVVVAYGKILRQEVLDIPTHGCINVHASLLPKYRGAAPIQWAVLNGETETGITTMQMDAGIDTGDMLLQDQCSISEDMTAGKLHDDLSLLGAKTLLRTLDLLEQGKLEPQKQDNRKSTYAPMLTRELSPIDFRKTAGEVHNHIRGLSPWPGATMDFEGVLLKVHKARVADSADSPLHILCGDGNYIELLTVQAPGKKTMPAGEFLRGRR